MSNFLVLIFVILSILFIISFFKKLKKTQDELKELITQRFEGQTIHLRDPIAFLVAQQSRGYSQRQGNGNLILTDHELFFAMTIPKTIISIPLKTIKNIERPLRMCGQCIMKKLLKINFTTPEGTETAIAWYVKELDRWENEILSRKNLLNPSS